MRAPGTPVHRGFPARSKLHRAQKGARLRVAPGTYVPAVAIRATEIPLIRPLYRGFPQVSTCKRNQFEMTSVSTTSSRYMLLAGCFPKVRNIGFVLVVNSLLPMCLPFQRVAVCFLSSYSFFGYVLVASF
jgi:hypothetical protein